MGKKFISLLLSLGMLLSCMQPIASADGEIVTDYPVNLVMNAGGSSENNRGATVTLTSAITLPTLSEVTLNFNTTKEEEYLVNIVVKNSSGGIIFGLQGITGTGLYAFTGWSGSSTYNQYSDANKFTNGVLVTSDYTGDHAVSLVIDRTNSNITVKYGGETKGTLPLLVDASQIASVAGGKYRTTAAVTVSSISVTEPDPAYMALTGALQLAKVSGVTVTRQYLKTENVITPSETFTWTVSRTDGKSTDGISVSSDGVLSVADTAEAGTVTIKCVGSTGKEATLDVTIGDFSTVTAAADGPKCYETGQTGQYAVTSITDTYGDDVTDLFAPSFSSDNTGVLTVDSATGEATAIAAGEANVTVSVGNPGKKSEIVIPVTVGTYHKIVDVSADTTEVPVADIITDSSVTGYRVTTADSDGNEITSYDVATSSVSNNKISVSTSGASKVEVAPIHEGVINTEYLIPNATYNVTATVNNKSRADLYVNDQMLINNINQGTDNWATYLRTIPSSATYEAGDIVISQGYAKFNLRDDKSSGALVTGVKFVKAPSVVNRAKRIYVIGDSLVARYYGDAASGEEGLVRTGWGQVLENYIADGVNVTNLGNAGAWAEVMLTDAFTNVEQSAQAGDILILESGYNDRSYSTEAKTKAAVSEMVTRAQAKGMTAFVVTPNASAHDYKADVVWSGVIREVTATLDGAILIDLAQKSYNFLNETYGELSDDERNTKLNAYYNNSGDTLHSSCNAANRWAAIVAQGLYDNESTRNLVNTDYVYTFNDGTTDIKCKVNTIEPMAGVEFTSFPSGGVLNAGADENTAADNVITVKVTGENGTDLTANQDANVSDYDIKWEFLGFRHIASKAAEGAAAGTTDDENSNIYCDSYAEAVYTAGSPQTVNFKVKGQAFNFYGIIKATVTYAGKTMSVSAPAVILPNKTSETGVYIPRAGYFSDFNCYSDDIVGYQAATTSDNKTVSDIITGNWGTFGGNSSKGLYLASDGGGKFLKLKAMGTNSSCFAVNKLDSSPASQVIISQDVRFYNTNSGILFKTAYPTSWTSGAATSLSLTFTGSAFTINGSGEICGAETGKWYRIVLSCDTSTKLCYAKIYNTDGTLLGESEAVPFADSGSTAPVYLCYKTPDNSIGELDFNNVKMYLASADASKTTASAADETVSIPKEGAADVTSELTVSAFTSEGYEITGEAEWSFDSSVADTSKLAVTPDADNSHKAALTVKSGAPAGDLKINVTIGGVTKQITINLTSSQDSVQFTQANSSLSIPLEAGAYNTYMYAAKVVGPTSDTDDTPMDITGKTVTFALYDKNNSAELTTLPAGVEFNAATGELKIGSDASASVIYIRAASTNRSGEAISKSLKITIHGLAFDFGSDETDAVAEGYTAVTPYTAYSDSAGYGIESGTPSIGGTASADSADSDNLSGTFTFKAKVTPAKCYNVTVNYLGSAVSEYVNSDLSGVALSNDTQSTVTYTIPVIDDVLDLAFDGTVASISIEKAADKTAGTKPNIYTIGDSTIANNGSWAYVMNRDFATYAVDGENNDLTDIATFSNNGRGGKNLCTYYTGGELRDRILVNVKPGDFVMIGDMGTNGMGNYFEEDFNYYIDACEAMGAKVILNSYTPHGAVGYYASCYNSDTQTFTGYRTENYDVIVRGIYAERSNESGAKYDENVVGLVDIGKMADAAFNAFVDDYAANGFASRDAAAQEIIACFGDHNHYSSGTRAAELMIKGYGTGEDAKGILQSLYEIVSANLPEPTPENPGENPGGETPQETNIPQNTEIPAVTENPQATELPRGTETPAVTELPRGTETPTVTELPKMTEAPAVTELPQGTETPAVTELPRGTETPAATELPKMTEAPMGTAEPTIIPTGAPTPENTSEPTATDFPASGLKDGDSGSDGEIEWSFNDGVLTVSGGAIPDYADGAPWSGGKDVITKVVITDGVTAVGANAFKDCAALKEIIIPDSVEHIGENVLSGCGSLRSIKIPFVGESNSVSTSGVTYEGVLGYLFGKSGEGTEQGEYKYAIPETLKKVEVTNSDINSVITPGAFMNCENIVDIIIDGGRTVYGGAFKNCKSLRSLYLPNTVSGMESKILEGCESLEMLTVPFIGINKSDQKTETSVMGALFGWSDEKGRTDVTQYYNETEYHHYHIPPTLKKVVVLGQTNIPYGAFMGCYVLEQVSIITGAVMGDKAFYDCGALKRVSLPSDLKEIGEEAFAECASLEYINIPSGAASIGKYAFYNDRKLKEITIPKSVESISDQVFAGIGMLGGEISLLGGDDLTIVCSQGSAAEEYAKSKGINYRLEDESAVEAKHTETVVNELTSDGSYMLTVTDTNTLSGTVYIAFYSDGKLSEIKSFKSDRSVSYNIPFEAETVNGADTVKVFVWDDDLKPQTASETQSL